MKTQGSIHIFINFKQAAQFGHVGWGFGLGDDKFFYGSTDHLWKHNWWDLPAWWRYMHVPAHGDIDWWAEQGSKTDMLNMMRIGPHIRYHAYKEVALNDTTPEQAILVAKNLRTGGWHLSKHNCVHQTFLIVSNYSNNHCVPDPFKDPLNLIPKTWFARIPGSQFSL